MRKPINKDNPEPVTPVGKKVREIVNYIEAVEEWVDDMKSKHELEPYILPSGKVDNKKVDESEDITPEQVAILGGYIMVRRIAAAVNNISKGEKPDKIPNASKKVEKAQGVMLDMVTGEAKMLGGGVIPPEALEALKDFINEQEQEDE